MAKLKKEIWLIRHATTHFNESDILQGSTDNPLSPRGIKEAAELAEKLKNEKFEIVCSSPLARALKTAESINSFHQAPLMILPELREISFGEWEGIHYPTIKNEFARDFQNWHRSVKSKPPQGESFFQLYLRSRRGMEKIYRLKEEKIAIVGHASVNRAILAYLLRLPLQTVRFFRLANCSVSLFYIFEEDQQQWTVLAFWNRTLIADNHD